MQIDFKSNITKLTSEEVAEFLKSHNLHQVFSSYEFSNLVQEIHLWTEGDLHKIREFVNFIA